MLRKLANHWVAGAVDLLENGIEYERLVHSLLEAGLLGRTAPSDLQGARVLQIRRLP